MAKAWQSGDLDRFSRSFKDEEHLREVLRDLLVRSGARQVRITHGQNERGKDLVFVRDGGLSRDVLYACVVKNARITGSVNSSRGSAAVLHQAIQALEEPYTDRATGTDWPVHSVFVISPYECTSAAIENFKNGLRSHGGRVTFLCGIDLLALFEQHWPDYSAIASSGMTRYLVDMRTGLSSDLALLAMLTRHNANMGLRPFSSAYVAANVELRWSRLVATRVPAPRELPSPLYLTWAETEEIASGLRFWRRALRARQDVEGDGETYRDLALAADATGRHLRSEWNRSSATRRTRSGRLGQEERRLAVSSEWRDQYGLLRNAASSLRHEALAIEKKAKALNDLLGELQCLSRDLLTSDAMLDCVSIAHHVAKYPELWNVRDQGTLPVSTELLNSACRAYVLVGPPGSGKTSFCRWQALVGVEDFMTRDSAPLPIYLAAHRLTETAMSTVEELVRGELCAGESEFESWDPAQTATVLFVDGLDEIPDGMRQRQVLDILRAGIARWPTLRVVITARPHVCGEWLNWLPHLHLAELDDAGQRELARNWLDSDTDVDAFFAQMASQPALKALMGTPLLATLILNLFRRSPVLPRSRAALYRAFVDVYCGGWAAAKGLLGVSRHLPDSKVRPLARLAFEMQCGHKRECTDGDVRRAVSEIYPGMAGQEDDFLVDVLQDGMLIRVGQGLAFAHLSFQEYLAAAFLGSDPTGKRARRALVAFIQGDEWWRESVRFYVTGLDDPLAIDRWIAQVSVKFDDDADERRGAVASSLVGMRARLVFLARTIQESFDGFVPSFVSRREV